MLKGVPSPACASLYMLIRIPLQPKENTSMFRIPRTSLIPVIAAGAVTLAACGGGGSGGDGSRPVASTHARTNPAAADPRDSWADPEPLRTALGLSPLSDPRARVAAIRAVANDPARTDIGARSLLDRIDLDDVEILGERDGIVYGHWKAGPTGTLDIEFDWRFAPNVDAGSRALMERAGKAWSQRLTDELHPHTLPAGTDITHGEDISKILDSPVTTDGVVVFVIDKGPSTDNLSSAGPREIDYSTDDFQPRAGTLLLNRKHHHSRGTMVHEVGHVLGTNPHHPAVNRYVDTDSHAFTGPAAMRANGGQPVPYQWIDSENSPVAPGTPGAEVDYGHPGVCTSVMAYCRDRSVVTDPSELDFAILDDIGYDILDAATAAQPEFYGYGAWANYSGWGIGVERVLDADTDRLWAGAHTFGLEPATPLADNEALSGLAVWTGSLLGVDTRDPALPPVVGDARLEIEIQSLVGSARFDNLTVSRDGRTNTFRSPSLEYAGSVAGNTFSDEGGRVSAGFFGPAHEEMAGVVNDRQAGLLAGFGGTQ